MNTKHTINIPITIEVEWDTDGEKFEASNKQIENAILNCLHTEVFSDELSEALTDETGWYHKGFNFSTNEKG